MSKVGFVYIKRSYPDDVNVSYRGNRLVPSQSMYGKIYDFECECGCVATLCYVNDAKRHKHECPQCQSKNIVELDKKYKSKMFNAKFELVERDGKNFKTESTRYKALFRKDGIVIKTIGTDSISFEDGEFSVLDYSGKERIGTRRDLSDVRQWVKRKGITAYDIINTVAKDEHDIMYLNFLHNNFKAQIGSRYYLDPCIFHALIKDYNDSHIERLYKAGINHSLINSIERYRGYSHMNLEAKKLHQMFNVPKYAMRIVRNHMTDFSSTKKGYIDTICRRIDGTNLNLIMDIVESETITANYDVLDLLYYISRLKDEYGYTNVQSLTNYICRRVKLEQGLDNPIESSRLLLDYVNIMKDLGFEYEKYPKSLKKVHDIAVMNKNALTKTSENAKFNEKITEEEYKGLEMKDKMFSIVAPSKSDDLIKEGQSLSHCVASYVKDVANGLCKVLFLRFTKEPEQSYMTIEVRGDEIKQFKGVSNRKASELDLSFIEKWAEKKGLKVPKYSTL